MSRTPRICVDQELFDGHELRPDQRALRHLTRVLRLKPGAAVRVFDGRGRERSALLMSGDGGLRLRLAEEISPAPESPLRLCLFQGISRGERMDLVIQKATELGVAEIQPVATERSVVRLNAERAKRRLEHWRGVARAACEQCGRATLPQVHAPAGLETALDRLPPEAGRWLLDAGGRGLPAAGGERPPAVGLLVGPEGGLTEAEKSRAADRGFSALSLGPRTLRTETAGIVAIAVLQALWGDLSASR